LGARSERAAAHGLVFTLPLGLAKGYEACFASPSHKRSAITPKHHQPGRADRTPGECRTGVCWLGGGDPLAAHPAAGPAHLLATLFPPSTEQERNALPKDRLNFRRRQHYYRNYRKSLGVLGPDCRCCQAGGMASVRPADSQPGEF